MPVSSVTACGFTWFPPFFPFTGYTCIVEEIKNIGMHYFAYRYFFTGNLFYMLCVTESPARLSQG